MGVAWLRRAAAGDDPLAEYTLGLASLQGLFGVPEEVKTAAVWFQKAAGQPDPAKSAAAQLALARLYAAGAGVPRSNEEAQKWYDKAVASTSRAWRSAFPHSGLSECPLSGVSGSRERAPANG